MKIAVLGAGAFGSALGGILEEKGKEVEYFDPYKFPERKLGEVLRFSQAIVLAIPAENLDEVLAEFPSFGFKKPLIVATKGLLSLESFKKFRQVEFISGPAFASQLREQREVNLTITGEIAEHLFKTGFIHFDRTKDNLGVIYSGSLKNIFAVEAGFRRLEPETIEFEQFIFKALEEMENFLEENGARRETAKLACGEGDLRLTCSSEESRNYRFGNSLRGKYFSAPSETTEALFTVQEIEREGLEIPRRADILRGIIRRIKDATQ